MSKYKCQEHLSNEGFYDEEGNFVCLYCYMNNIFKCPKGRLLKQVRLRKYILRILDKSTKTHKQMAVQVFIDKGDKKILDHKYTTRDLSVALRHYQQLHQDIEERRYKRDRREESEGVRLTEINTAVSSESSDFETISSEAELRWISDSTDSTLRGDIVEEPT